MNVLIITDALTAPLYTSRVRFLNRQLLAEGHSVVWYTERSEVIPEDVRPSNLVEIPYYGKHDHLLKGILSVLFDMKSRLLLRNIDPPFHPEIIFCSTFHTFGLHASCRLAERYKCPLHIDLRDIAEQTPTNAYSRSFLSHNSFYRNISIRRRNATLRKATIVTSVSKFHRDFLSAINPNSHVIYNGYDANLFYPPKEKPINNPIIIIYTGRWYGEDLENPIYLFRALSHHHEIKLVFYTATNVHDKLRRLAKLYDVNIDIHPYVPNSEVPALIRNSDFSLMLSNHGNRGCLSTKFFEALGSSVPVISTPSDEGEMAELVRETDGGLSSSDPDEILSFILNKPERKQKDNSFFSRQHQTELLIKLMSDTINNSIKSK